MGRLSWAVALLLFPATAGAQPAAPTPPSQDTLSQPTPQDAMVVVPLHLSLLAPFVPHPADTPGCEGASAGSATGSPLFPHQGAAGMGASPFGYGNHAPRLTLSGFSRGGCMFDTAVGGGAALSVPIAKDVFFAWSGGAIYLPEGRGSSGIVSTTVRADIIFQRPGGRAYTVGVGAFQGGPHVSFGGIF